MGSGHTSDGGGRGRTDRQTQRGIDRPGPGPPVKRLNIPPEKGSGGSGGRDQLSAGGPQWGPEVLAGGFRTFFLQTSIFGFDINR